MFTRTAIATLACIGTTFAHMELSWPYPLHSKFNPATPENIKDYSMTEPLGVYPCKGYINNPSSDMESTVTWAAGSTFNYTLAGSATHGGGSCQLSLSYDSGKTWSVIQSTMGGCMIEGTTLEGMIPKEAPSGEALFSWTWFNLIGNREMYQNCAVVTITGGGSGLDATDYPPTFVANVAAAPDCHTVEGTNVVFPNPGKNAIYGGVYKNSKPTTVAGITGSCATASAASTPAVDTTSSTSTTDDSGASGAAAGAGAVASPTTSHTANVNTGHELHLGPGLAANPSDTLAPPTTNGAASCKKKRGVERRHERLLKKAVHESLV